MIESQTTTTNVNKITFITKIYESSEKFIDRYRIKLNNEILIAILIWSKTTASNPA